MIFVDFTKAFDSIHRRKMEQILLAYGIPKETVAAITILYRNTKVKVRSPDGDTEYFDIVACVLQGDTLAPYLFIICLDYVLRTSIDKIRENGFELTKKYDLMMMNYMIILENITKPNSSLPCFLLKLGNLNSDRLVTPCNEITSR